MKKLLFSWCLCCAVMLAAADPVNLLKNKPPVITNPRTTVFQNGVYTITNPNEKTVSSLVWKFDINQTKPEPITFAVEAQAIENQGNHGCYFGMILNLIFADGTRLNGINFGMGKDTFDWSRNQRTYAPAKPVKQVEATVQYTRAKGRVAFRNPSVMIGKPAKKPATAASYGFAIPFQKLGKHKITHTDRNLKTELVRRGKPVAAIVGDAELAKILNAAIQTKTGTTLPVLPHTAYGDAEKLDRHLIIIGSRDNNRSMSNLYCRHFALIDGKYPGPGGHDVHSLHNPFGDKFNVILAGGSDAAGDRKAVEVLANHIRKNKVGKSLSLGFISDAALSPSYKVAKDVKDIPLWEFSIGYGNKGYFGWNSLARNLAMLYITNDPYYKNEFMRLAFPKDKATQKELFQRDDEAFHDPADPIVKVYHYRGQFMTLYWDMVDENPLFSDEERQKVNQKLYEQLVFRLTRNDYTNPYRNYNTRKLVRPDRHYCWEVLTAYTAARFLDKDHSCFDTKEGLRLGQNAMEPLYEKPLIGNIALFWVVTSTELQYYYAALQGHRLIGNPVLKENAKCLTMISNLGKGSDDRNGIYGSSWLYLIGAFYAQDEGMFTLLKNKALPGNFAATAVHDHNVFRVGQSYWPSAQYPNDSIKDNAGKWLRYSTAKPSEPSQSELLFTVFRNRGDASGDYLMIDPHYSKGRRDHQHNFAMLYAHLNGGPLLAGYENALVPYANGLNISKYPFDAEQVTSGTEGPFSWIRGVVRNFNGFDWERTWILREGKYLAAVDKLTALQDHAAAKFDIKYTAGFNGKVAALPDGDFQSSVDYNGKRHEFIWSFADNAPALATPRNWWATYLPGDAVLYQPVKTDMAKGTVLQYVSFFRTGNALETRSSAREGNTVALRTPEPVLLTLKENGFTLAGKDQTFTLAGDQTVLADGDAAAAAQAMQMLKNRERKTFSPPEIAEDIQKLSSRGVVHLAHAPGRIISSKTEAGVAAGNTFTVFSTITGKTVFRMELDAPIFATAYHPEAKLWLVGTKDERLTAFDAQGKVRWTFTSEMAPETRKLGPYWHKSAIPGVRSLLVHKGKIFAGSAATMEVLDANGKLLARKYVLYGGLDEIFPHPVTGKVMILRPSGGAALMAIDPDTFKVEAHNNWALGLTDNLNSYGFNQVGQYQVLFFKNKDGIWRAADLLSGAQNRFIIRDAKGKALYEANFGPGMLGHNLCIPARSNRTMREMAVADLNGDGAMEFAVTHANGSIYILNEKAEVLKLYNLFTLVRSLATDGKVFYAGLTDGRILKIDLNGVRTINRIKGDIYLLKVLDNGHLLAGSSTGDLFLF